MPEAPSIFAIAEILEKGQLRAHPWNNDDVQYELPVDDEELDRAMSQAPARGGLPVIAAVERWGCMRELMFVKARRRRPVVVGLSGPLKLRDEPVHVPAPIASASRPELERAFGHALFESDEDERVTFLNGTEIADPVALRAFAERWVAEDHGVAFEVFHRGRCLYAKRGRLREAPIACTAPSVYDEHFRPLVGRLKPDRLWDAIVSLPRSET